MSYSKKRSGSLDSQNKTMPLRDMENEDNKNIKTQRGSSVEEIKFPTIEIKKVMKKIGAVDK